MADTTKKDNISEDPKKLFTKETPHPSGAYWDPVESKWKGYKATKGFSPPWNPFNPENRRKRTTVNERKFLMVLSTTGSINEAFRAVYKIPVHPDKRIENARIQAMGSQILARLKAKAPALVSAFTFEDITPDFIKKEYMKLYNSDHATIAEKRAMLSDMAKMHAMFSDKIVLDNKIRDSVDSLYKESDDDFPDHKDERISRTQIEEKVNIA
jgi:hypothetical protein